MLPAPLAAAVAPLPKIPSVRLALEVVSEPGQLRLRGAAVDVDTGETVAVDLTARTALELALGLWQLIAGATP